MTLSGLCIPVQPRTNNNLLSCQQIIGVSHGADQEHPRTSGPVGIDFSGQILSVQAASKHYKVVSSTVLLGSVTVGLACAFPTGVCSSICAFLRSSNMNPAQLSLGSLLLPCSVMPTGSGLNSPATHCCLVPSSAGTQKVNSRSLEMRMLSVLIENQITTLTEPGRCNSCSVGLHPSTGGWRIS